MREEGWNEEEEEEGEDFSSTSSTWRHCSREEGGRKREEDLEGWSIVLLGRIKKHTRDRLFVILMKKLADKGIVARGLHLVETLHQDPSLFLYSVAANKTRGFKADLSGRGVSSRADWKEASLQHWKRDFAGNLTGDAFIFSINILRIYIVSFYVINFMHMLKLY